jgi:hypothetical protein
MATIVTVACDNITKKCTGKITGKDATLTDQAGINRWLNSITTINSSLSSAESGSAELAELSAEPPARSSAESSAESEPPAGSAAGEPGLAPVGSAPVGSAPVGSANSSALVAFKSSPVGRSMGASTFSELLAALSNQPESVRNKIFELAQSVPPEQILAFQQNLDIFLKKPKSVRNRIFNNLLVNTPSDLSQALDLSEGGRKTRTSHKRRKASKKTRKAQ